LQKVRGRDAGGPRFTGAAPQYSLQLGYYNKKKNWGIEFNFDHIKYFVRQNQRVGLRGIIDNVTYDTDTLLTPNFVQLEHSDGANYAMFKLTRWFKLLRNVQGFPVFVLLAKAGGGPVIPKTNSTIMDKHRDDRYHIAGYVVGLEGGLRYNLSQHLFAEGDAKGTLANYNNFLIAEGKGSQKWRALTFSVLLGYSF
jgi:hypothetical protein